MEARKEIKVRRKRKGKAKKREHGRGIFVQGKGMEKQIKVS